MQKLGGLCCYKGVDPMGHNVGSRHFRRVKDGIYDAKIGGIMLLQRG
jgi:hypothetical protein